MSNTVATGVVLILNVRPKHDTRALYKRTTRTKMSRNSVRIIPGYLNSTQLAWYSNIDESKLECFRYVRHSNILRVEEGRKEKKCKEISKESEWLKM